MRISTLKIKNFKGFANKIEINLKGKNLAIYGENGSGKTSLVEALKLFFDSASSEIELEKYENVFMKQPVEISIETTDGKTISLRTKSKRKRNDKGNEKEITVTNPNEYNYEDKMFLDALSRSTSILSYRQLMKIYDLKTAEDFYELFIRNIMAYYLIPPRREKTLIEELQELEKLKKESPKAKKRIKDKEESIKNEINKIFIEIRDKWNEYARILTGDDIEIECSIEELGKLNFSVKWNGKDVSNILTYLNEGRLNAISLGLFLSYYNKFNVSRYKMLLLDDVVIGLDMNLRIPLLDILQEDFEDEYQIIITTFDENWFKLMDEYLDKGKWVFVRLITKKTDNTHVPYIVGVEENSINYLVLAQKHLNNGDYSAAALYIRLEFEKVLKRFARDTRLEIIYGTDKIEKIWQKVEPILKENRGKTLANRVKIYRKILLNPAVHFDTRPKYKNEVKYALEVVEKLKNKLNDIKKRSRRY